MNSAEQCNFRSHLRFAPEVTVTWLLATNILQSLHQKISISLFPFTSSTNLFVHRSVQFLSLIRTIFIINQDINNSDSHAVHQDTPDDTGHAGHQSQVGVMSPGHSPGEHVQHTGECGHLEHCHCFIRSWVSGEIT